MRDVPGFPLAILALLCLCLGPQSVAQRSETPFSTSFVLVSAFDARGNPVNSLSIQNFRVRVNSKPVTVRTAHYTFAPRRIVVLLDMSGSMSGFDNSGKWKIACDAVRELITQTSGEVPIAMMTFSSTVEDVFDFSASRDAIAHRLARTTPYTSGSKLPKKTALLDAIAAGLKLLEPFQPGDALYAITDAGENASRVSDSQVHVALLQSGVRLFVLFFSEPISQASSPKSIGTFLDMVEASGGYTFPLVARPRPFQSRGVIYDPNCRAEVKQFTLALNAMVRGLWALEIPASPSKKTEKIKLEIVDNTGKVIRNIHLAYAHALPPTY